MQLIIAEKPSVGAAIATALGAAGRKSGYIEGGGIIVSWCIGHLVGLAEAGSYDERFKKWRYDDLPILPDEWNYALSPGKEEQFAVLKSLMEHPDISEVVNACDAGREGELIFRLVYEAAGCTKPISRLWISSMEDTAIREGFQNLKPGAEYEALYQSALCRSKADWLIGINATRLFSVLYHKTLNVGRVQTPTFSPDVAALLSDKNVSDHHAIIPTMEAVKTDLAALPVGERSLFLLICCKLLCAAGSPHMFEAITAVFECGSHSFTAKGKTVLAEGWKVFQRLFRTSLKEKPEDDSEGESDLPELVQGRIYERAAASVTEHYTAPPKPYTEDTLLSAMERAGKDNMPEDAERKGLGTPATRAAIIEKLVSSGFAERKGKNLTPTKDGINLITVLPEVLISPLLTADWEQRLSEIAKGAADPSTFMEDIQKMAAELVAAYSHISEDGQKLFAPQKEPVGACPRCGEQVYEGKKNFYCGNRGCGFVLWKNDRFWLSRKKELTKKMAADLLKEGRTKVKGMYSEKKGSAYDATVLLDDTGGKYINFKLEFEKKREQAR